MKALLIDDESFARVRLAALLADCEGVTVAGEARNGLEALQQIRDLEPDLLFLDIEMPGLNGFDVLRSLPEPAPVPLVVFVTGYDQYALKAFDANAVAYLLKPVEKERLRQVVERARLIFSSSSEREKEQQQIEHTLTAIRPELRQIVANRGRNLVLLRPDEVVLFQMEDGIVTAHLAKERWRVNYQFSELEAGLPPELFFLARRSVLINLTKIKQIALFLKSSFLLTMNDAAESEIHVSERQSRLLRLRIPGL